MKEIEIYDTHIIHADDTGLTYIGSDGKNHLIEYSLCAENYAKTHNQATICVGERDITNTFFLFCTPNVAIKVIFKSRFVFNKKKHLFVGNRLKRFNALRQLIIESGYSTYDLS